MTQVPQKSLLRKVVPLGRPSDEEAWSLEERGGTGALQVAQRLLKLELASDLRYRDVPLEAAAVDVTPCSGRQDGGFYRYYLLRPVAAFAEALPAEYRDSLEWRSEVLILPRTRGEGMMMRLAPFEAEFAVRSFLRRVEREIDAILAGHEPG